jgi:voltage-gated potassium channel Kch
LLVLTGVALGVVGFGRYFADAPAWRRHPWELLYRTIQLVSLNFNTFDKPLDWTLQVARLLMPALAVYAAVKGLAALYVEQLQTLRVRLFAHGHTIICGLGQKGLLLARRLRERGERVVVIEQNEENDLIRAARNAGCVVLLGDATESYVLARAGISRAHHIVAVCRDDGLNAEIAVRSRDFAAARGFPLHCVCHVFDTRLWSLLKERGVLPGKSQNLRLDFRNVYKEGAAELLKHDPGFPAPAVGTCPNALVVGIGRMGESLLVELARRWSQLRGSGRDRICLTMVDRLAKAKHDFLLSEYPDLADTWDLVPIELDINSPRFQEGDFLLDTGEHGSIQRAYVCLDDDSLGLMAALRIQHQLNIHDRHVPIFVRTRHQGGLASLLRSVDDPTCAPDCVRAFGLLDHTCRPELWLDEAATEPH